jgi:hypothetical protein
MQNIQGFNYKQGSNISEIHEYTVLETMKSGVLLGSFQ